MEHLSLSRHRKFQMMLSALTLGALGLGLHPEYSYMAVWVGVVTNLIWIWE